MKTVTCEKDVQVFIGQYPWLLNINYQKVPELGDAAFEYYVDGNKRLDLILRDYITGNPVIVEFKFCDLTRDSVGQIIEYRARIINALNNEDDALFQVFGNRISTPKLVLVVAHSDDYGKMACALQNIELYEYGDFDSKIINDVPFVKRVSDFEKNLKEISPPINHDRSEYLDNNIYSYIKSLFEANGIMEKWKNYRNAELGEWWSWLKTSFLNKHFMQDEEISFGIYENLLNNGDMSVCISYYSDSRERLEKLQRKLKGEYRRNVNIEPDDECYLLEQQYDSSVFFKNFKTILSSNFETYMKCIGEM